LSGLFPEFTEAVTRLQQAWGRDRRLLDARAKGSGEVETMNMSFSPDTTGEAKE
jgi:hypothetical protein